MSEETYWLLAGVRSASVRAVFHWSHASSAGAA